MQSQDSSQTSSIEQLITLMQMLRDGEFGCPWDLEQSLRSLIPHTIEEVYEVVDAIERDDMVDLEDELGDLLFQVVFYAQIAAEQKLFDFNDVAAAITRKLVRRHPHVFPGGKLEAFGRRPEVSSEQVLVNWETIKQQEREEKSRRQAGSGQSPAEQSVLGDIPRALPSLERARKLQKRAAHFGFDWETSGPVVAKLKEEIQEFESALVEGDSAHAEAELGDILFASVNLARHCGIEPESALRGANNRFEARFRWIESRLKRQGKELEQTDLSELELLWQQAKSSGL